MWARPPPCPAPPTKPTQAGLQVDGKAIETLVGLSTDTAAVDKLKTFGIHAAAKTLKLDLGDLVTQLNGKGEFFGHDKIERDGHPGRRQDPRHRERQ